MSSKVSKTKKCAGCSFDLGILEQLKCATCSLRYHYDCINTTNAKYKELTTDYKINWICPTCRSKQPKGDNSNTPVRSSASTAFETSPSSNVTLRRTQLCTQQNKQTDNQELLTLDSVRQLIQEERKILLSEIEENMSRIMENKLKSMSKEINEIKESVAFANNQYEDLKQELLGKLTQVNELKRENEKLKSTVQDLNSRLSIMEQHSRMCNLEIQCLPEHKAENLPLIISQIGKITGNNISDSDIHKCTRIAKINPDNTRPRSVIVKFSSPRTRDTFLAGVLNFNKMNKDNKLNSSHAGLGGVIKPIYVVEHLTPEVKKLHAFARLTAKKLNYKFVWIKNGRVFLRKTDNSNHIVVRNFEQLEKLT